MAPIIAMLAKAGLPLLVQAVLSKGQDVVEEKLGVDLGGMLGSEEGRIRLKELELTHEQFLAEQVVRHMEKDLERQALEDKDRANARDMNSRIQESENASWLAKNAAYCLDFVIIGGVIVLAIILFVASIPEANRELAYTFFGSVLTLAITVVNFHRGSSRGSADKQQTLDAMWKGGAK
jgi:hypothetical protein